MTQHTSARSRAGRFTGLSLATIAAGLLLAGCSTTDAEEPASAAPYQSATAAADKSLEALRDCMLDAGWEVAIVEQPGSAQGLEGTYPDDQQSQYDAALAGCQASSGWGEGAPDMTAGEADAYYDALADTAQCLEDEGYETPPAPSRQSFIDAATRGEFIWDPFASFFEGEDVDLEELNAADAACPLPTS